MSDKVKVLFFDYWPGIDYQNTSGAGLGSSLFKLAALADAHLTGFEVHFLTSATKSELLGDALGIDFIYSNETNINFENFYKVINLGISADQLPEKITSLNNYQSFSSSDRKLYKDSGHLWFWRNFVSNALVINLTDSSAKVELCMESESLIEAAKLMPSEFKWISISYQSISTLKDYGEWSKVINTLLNEDEKIRIVLLGHEEKTGIDDPRVLNLMGKTDIQLLKAVISRSELVIGVDGLATNLSQALDTPSLILFTIIAPEHVLFETDSEKVTYMVNEGCPYQFCYKGLINYRNSGCRLLKENEDIKTPLCLSFNPDKIVDEAIKLLLSQKSFS